MSAIIPVTAAEVGQVWSWGLQLGGVDKLWLETKGAGVTWGIVDTGIDTAHPDFAGAIKAARDFTNSGFGVEDRAGHGTHTAGTIASRDNGRGVVGVAPECQLLVAKVLGDDGSGSTEAVAQGVEWCLDNGADGISLSLGSPYGDPRLRAALQRAIAAGKFVVCAAGNDGPTPNSIDFPGKWTECSLTVGAVDNQGRLADFSSRGPELDVCAPGVHILSCWPGGGYAFLDGTSMATPFVAGAVALMVAYRRKVGLAPIAGQADLEAQITRAAIRPAGQEKTDDWGFGLFDPSAILASKAPAAPDLGPLKPISFGPFALGGYDWTLSAVPTKGA